MKLTTKVVTVYAVRVRNNSAFRSTCSLLYSFVLRIHVINVNVNEKGKEGDDQYAWVRENPPKPAAPREARPEETPGKARHKRKTVWASQNN